MATQTLVPLATYPAQQRSFEAALPAGTTSLVLAIHAPLQTPAFDYSLDFWLSPDGGAHWEWFTGASGIARATETTIRLDTVGKNRARVDVTLRTAMQVQVTSTTTP